MSSVLRHTSRGQNIIYGKSSKKREKSNRLNNQKMKKINVKHKKMQKKAQVTVFIILGLFILVSVGIFTYFTSEIFKYKNLPEQFVPVAKYAEQCTEDVLLQGIFQAGINGGYVYPQYEEDEAYLKIGRA